MTKPQTDELLTRADLHELLRVHLDEPMMSISRRWLIRCLAMQTAVLVTVIAAIRL